MKHVERNRTKGMRRTIAIALLMSVLLFLYAENPTQCGYDAFVDLNTATSSSDDVTATFNDDGNIQVTYKGREPVAIAVSGNLDGTLIVKSDKADYTIALFDATIKGDTLPAIQLKSKTTATIFLPSGTSSHVADSPNNTKKGTVTSSGDVIIDGDGSITLGVFKNHGLKIDGSLTIEGGDITISTGENSSEGIEAQKDIIINGGNLHAFTTDDSLNAGKRIIINGGRIYAQSYNNDSIDSNGIIQINGGTVIAISHSATHHAFDCDNDKRFIYKGGTILALGNGNNIPKGTGTTTYSIAYGKAKFSSDDNIAVLDKNGNVIMGFIVPSESHALGSIVFGCPAFSKNQVYTIARGSFPDKSAFIDGLVYGNADFITSSVVASFTLTDYTVSEGYIGKNK